MPPKIYRGLSCNGEENVEDEIDSCMSTNFMNTVNVNPVASDILSARDVVNKTLSDLQSDGDCVEMSLARQLSSTPQDEFVVATPLQNHCGEGGVDPMLQKLSDNIDRHSKYEACDTVDRNEVISPADQPSGDVNIDNTVSERGKELDDDSNNLQQSREKSVSPPMSIPGSNVGGVVNGSGGSSQPQCLGSIAEDSTTPTALTPNEVGSGSSALFPSFYCSQKKSVARFTPAGSFIIPADEDIYVDLSCGLFSTDPGHVGRVQDVSTLPSPREQPFTIGDDDQDDLVYYSENESVAGALAMSGQSFRSQKTSAYSECQQSDGEVSKRASASYPDIKVEMIDATSRDVLDEIFRRTSGKAYHVVL